MNHVGNPDPTERHAQGRAPIVCDVTLRRDGGNNSRVRLFDLSPCGCKVELVERLRISEGVWVRSDGLEAVHARVSWVKSPVAGLRFEHPMHQAVFESLARRLGAETGMP